MDKCPNCGGIFPLNDFVCQYCGYVETEKLKQLSGTDTKEISFDDSLNVLQDNLNVLHEINKPSVKNGITGVLRIIIAIHTLGVVLIFWKKPQKRFNKKSYDNLKKIIQRNILLMKISASGSEQLIKRIEVIEEELKKTDTEVKKNLRAKQITSGFIITAYVIFFFANAQFNPISEHPVYPLSKQIEGSLNEILNIEPGAVKLRYYGEENLEHFRMYVKFKPVKKFTLEDSTDLIITAELCDSAGNSLPEFAPSELSGIHTNTILRQLKKDTKHIVQVEFEIQEKRALNSLPENLTHFKIHTEMISIKE